jgi:hypothetical protein
MKTITATELARNLSEILDRLAVEREGLVIERNHHQVACLLPGPGRLTTLEALADVYRTLSEDAAATWEGDSRASGLQGEWSRLTRRSCPGAVKEGARIFSTHSLRATTATLLGHGKPGHERIRVPGPKPGPRSKAVHVENHVVGRDVDCVNLANGNLRCHLLQSAIAGVVAHRGKVITTGTFKSVAFQNALSIAAVGAQA